MKKCYRWGMLFCLPVSSFADDLQGDRIQVVLSNLLAFVGGAWGAAICSLAVAGVGFACFIKGAVPVSRFLTVLIGAACVMGAPRLVDLMMRGA